MRITPISEEAIELAALIPTGRYPFYIDKAEEKVSKSGKDMLVVTLVIQMPGGSTRRLTDYIISDPENDFCQRKLRHFLYGIGHGDIYENHSVESHHIIGSSGTVIIGVQPPKDGYGARNTVTDYVKQEGSVTSEGTFTNKASMSQAKDIFIDDDIPF